MSTFEVRVQPIFIKNHPTADRLDLANIGSHDGWQCVVAKGRFVTGDLVAYIGENAIVPDWVLKKYGYWNDEKDVGMLAGSKGNRVKAIKLRGEFSLGICIPVEEEVLGYDDFDKIVLVGHTLEGEYVQQDEDVSELLGVTKYEAPIPVALAGEVCNLTGYTLKYDIENYKNYPDVIQDGEEVIFTEKIHGTWCAAGIVPELDHPEIEDGKFVVSSKGLSGQGLAFKFNEQNANNVYLKAFWSIKNVLQSISDDLGTVYILGEIFGPIQDLRYGFTDPQFRVFDIYVGLPSKGHYLDMLTVINICNKYGLQHVPVLYRGPFTREILKQYTDGKETVSGLSQHIREGVVANVIPERFHPKLGRVVVKSVSEDYLTRKNKDATEFN